MPEWRRKSKPEGTEVPRGAPPGGIWEAIVVYVQGTVRRHRTVKGYRYLPPTGDGGPGELWYSDLEGFKPTVSRVTDPEEILNSGKMKAAGDDTPEE